MLMAAIHPDLELTEYTWYLAELWAYIECTFQANDPGMAEVCLNDIIFPSFSAMWSYHDGKYK